MMRYLRGHVAKVIFGVLLVAFIAWIVLELGMQGRVGTVAGGVVAKVNSDKVTTQEFWLLYNQEAETTWRAIRGSMTERDERELRKTVLDRLIDQTLIWQEAKRLGYAATREDALAKIKTFPAFLNEQRQFDPQRYQAALNRIGIPRQLFEQQQERAMSTARLEAFNRDSMRVTDLELWLEYLRWHRRVQALILKFQLAKAKAQIEVTADEVKNYWEQNRRQFEKVEKVRIRHIVVQANPQAGPEAAAQARAKMETIVAEIKRGADFVDVAKRKSEDASTAQRGGDLGWRIRGELIDEYNNRVFDLKAGQLSEVFQTQFGYHLIKCDERQEEEKPEFKEVKGKIRETILNGRAREQLLVEVTRAAWHVKMEKDLKRVAERVGRSAVQTSWFERGKKPPVGVSKETVDAITQALSPLEAGDVTDVIETEEGFFIVQLTNEQHRRAPEAGFLEEREDIEPVLLARKQRAAYDAWVSKLREKAKIKILQDRI